MLSSNMSFKVIVMFKVLVISGVFGLEILVGLENLMQSVSSERRDHSTFDHKIAAE